MKKRIAFISVIVLLLIAVGIWLYLFIPETVTSESLLSDDFFQLKKIAWKTNEKAVSRAWRLPLKEDPFAAFIPANENILNSSNAVVMDGKKGEIQFIFRDDQLNQISLSFPDAALTEWPEQVLQEFRRVYGPEDSSGNGSYVWYKGETMLQLVVPKDISGSPLMIGIGLQVQYQ